MFAKVCRFRATTNQCSFPRFRDRGDDEWRIHILHDPARWKLHHIGNYFLNGGDR